MSEYGVSKSQDRRLRAMGKVDDRVYKSLSSTESNPADFWNIDALEAKWREEVYSKNDEINANADKGGAEYESLCVGWALAQGLSVEEAYNLYQEFIKRECF